MSVPLRIIDTGERSARWNVAMTAVLAEMHRTDRIPDTLRIHRYPASVLIGCHQVIGQAVHLDACRTDGIEIARRVTGGGAVYMAPGALAWDLVVARKTLGAELGQAAAMVGDGIALALGQFGLPARYRPENEVEIAGRKICGMSGYFDGGTLVYQGTILVNTDLAEMARYLKPPNGTPSSRVMVDRLITMAQVLGRAPDMQDIAMVLAAGISHVLGRRGTLDRPSAEELESAEDWARKELGSDFIAGGVVMAADMASANGRDTSHQQVRRP
jgi:lipoate-protein ligase A